MCQVLRRGVVPRGGRADRAKLKSFCFVFDFIFIHLFIFFCVSFKGPLARAPVARGAQYRRKTITVYFRVHSGRPAPVYAHSFSVRPHKRIAARPPGVAIPNIFIGGGALRFGGERADGEFMTSEKAESLKNRKVSF